MLGLEIFQQTIEKIKMIQDRIKVPQIRQKSYQDIRRKTLEFQEGDNVLLRVTLVTGVGHALMSKSLRRVSLVFLRIFKG